MSRYNILCRDGISQGKEKLGRDIAFLGIDRVGWKIGRNFVATEDSQVTTKLAKTKVLFCPRQSWPR